MGVIDNCALPRANVILRELGEPRRQLRGRHASPLWAGHTQPRPPCRSAEFAALPRHPQPSPARCPGPG
jgi:hypothetical protein